MDAKSVVKDLTRASENLAEIGQDKDSERVARIAARVAGAAEREAKSKRARERKLARKAAKETETKPKPTKETGAPRGNDRPAVQDGNTEIETAAVEIDLGLYADQSDDADDSVNADDAS